ncbi:MAG: LON peptidase substrate-binding domain-containing protein [Candidatus Moduliflexus flocculans]|nr:LON peptidase substrate-binding domain-containing protein [Candidatus Moduliflexus flocculans]
MLTTTRSPSSRCPDVVLFPGVFLPLHIFELRYREMVKDTPRRGPAHRHLAAPAGLGSRHAEGRPAIYPVGCVGLISHIEELSDGRYNLVLRGVEKFRVVREEERTRAYRRAVGRLLRGAHDRGGSRGRAAAAASRSSGC